jgi:hypothetical protein
LLSCGKFKVFSNVPNVRISGLTSSAAIALSIYKIIAKQIDVKCTYLDINVKFLPLGIIIAMSSRHSSRKKSSRSKPASGNRHIKSNNVMVIKLVDPIIQSLLFILFVYSLDTSAEFNYRKALYMIIGWQLISSVFNFIINPPNILKKERLIYLVVICLYMPCFFYIEAHVTEVWLTLRPGDNPDIPLYDLILESIAGLIAFWYYVICFREIREMMGKIYADD